MTSAVHQHRRLDFETVLRPSRWARGMQVIGALPEYVVRQLGITSAARSVWLHEHTVVHIAERTCLTPGDSEFVFEYMPAAVLRPMFCGFEARGGALRISLAEYITMERRYVYLAVKLTRTVRGEDELWVSTGYPMNEATLRRYLRSGRLQGIVGRTLEGGKTRTARRLAAGAVTQMP
ncbi:MAG TPA: hypothetical protein VNA89_07635 [Gemmatimonadaceae bacterium]|nr:hypothetical protein [Gemmatimonadaceae bacterium]